MHYWNDRLKLGKGSRFIKRDLRLLPLTEAEFEADFFLVPSSTKGQELWMGMVITRGFDDVLAMDDVQFPPPTVNNLANLLAHAMLRPLTDRDRQRPQTVHLRDRPQWPELFTHLQQLGIQVVFDPLSIVTIHLTDEELRLILTETSVARTKKLRPRLEAIVGSQQGAQLPIYEWGRLVFSSCGAGRETRIRERLMAIAEKIARSLADAVGLERPPTLKK